VEGSSVSGRNRRLWGQNGISHSYTRIVGARPLDLAGDLEKITGTLSNPVAVGERRLRYQAALPVGTLAITGLSNQESGTGIKTQVDGGDRSLNRPAP
jgi:hypothetical protein